VIASKFSNDILKRGCFWLCNEAIELEVRDTMRNIRFHASDQDEKKWLSFLARAIMPGSWQVKGNPFSFPAEIAKDEENFLLFEREYYI
jgi:hypothetical protein